MAHCLVLGHTGLVGSHLMEALRDTEHTVVGASKSTGCDLNDPEVANEIIQKENPDVLYMLAANAAESTGQHSPIDMTQNNIGIFVNVLVAAANNQVKRIIYTSSTAVYGDAIPPHSENGVVIPKDVYGVNKLACEQILEIMSKIHGISYTIVRPHNVYGEHQRMNDTHRNVVALFMRKLMRNETYKLYGHGTMKRCFSYAPDVAKALVTLLEPKYEGLTVNIGGRLPYSIKELSDTLQSLTGITVPIELVDVREAEIHDSIIDHRVQDSMVGYRDTPLWEGLRKTWEWAKKQELSDPIEREKEIK